MNRAVTHGISVTVTPQYEAQHSAPAMSRYVHSYTILIENKTGYIVQLISRHWYIMNGIRAVKEVEGAGVIGKQPILEPGQSFEYSSWCPLNTTVGKMYGTFTFLNHESNKFFDVEIPEFPLNAGPISN